MHVLKGDHVRLQYISFGYTLDKNMVKKLPLVNLEIYFNAANLGILWRSNDENLDPEFPVSIPPSKNWSFGLRGHF
jgi:hypothetical protein